MDVIDRIKSAVASNHGVSTEEAKTMCTFLDRLREPTEEMKKALLDAPGPFTPVYFAQVFIAAAQEGL